VRFLAFALWKTLAVWQSRAGLGNSPRTVLEEVARIQSHDVVLPSASHGLRQAGRCRRLHVSTGSAAWLSLPKRWRLAEHELRAPAASA